ncbi:glycoside hydrolase family 61 protein [Pseudomassariella vexata]|uniref:lytic cellulose monooxygenase (C4-dehydrogenating) n=1 Tax=Pseudomassariella vexata TaxID=1141098 RepID=A0A1Y2DLH4_9PEZI|nr:glycoside hydrolase family 61 protein [Pseudomassariella vexata]ORY60009.1 glycoside hydrolase family 61 protein [Pseudomassariella vexata]
MKNIIALVIISAVQAHYTFPDLIYNDVTETDWTYVRQTENYQSHGPVQNVTSESIRCYQLAAGNEGAQTQTVTAGDVVGFRVDPSIQHPGPLAFYMAKAPTGEVAADFDGAGDVWFKIYDDQPTFAADGLTWPSAGLTEVNVTIPECVAPGEYLLRVEHIALHAASSVGGAQFYIACAQLTVEGGGTTEPEGVALPGAYSATDPGILFQLYYPVPTSYVNPGPAPITC